MDFKQIRAFVQVAELGSFTRAAAVLQIAQPALSRQVRALEVDLRQTLFARNGRGVMLTEAGTRLLAHGRGILQQVERARQDLADPSGAVAGLLSIGLPPSLSRTLTVPLVGAFRARFPRATLTMVEGLSNYTLEWLEQGRIDCAVVYNATPSAAVDLQPVVDEQLFLVSSRSPGSRVALRPATLADVAAHELVIPSRPHAIRMRLETVLAQASLKPRVDLEIESVPAILDLVHSQRLHAVLSRSALLASGHEADFMARPIVLGPKSNGPVTPLATTLWIATSAHRPRGPLLEQTVALLAELLRRDLAGQPIPAKPRRT
jgi:LysR family nitrogen assimilation transcriptional regulator